LIQSAIFSYKNKNLKRCVDQLFLNTESDIFLKIFDKHNLDRESLFDDAIYKDKISYTHVFWDELEGPAEYKGNFINNDSSEYLLLFSDDVLLSPGWDTKAISFLENNENSVLSGTGELKVYKENLFFLKQERLFSLEFNKTNFIDRNFIFGKTEKLKNVYPVDVKYYGEEELLSLNLFKNNINIFSGPSNFYEDLKQRTFENKYTTFSLEHNYNLVVQEYDSAPEEFLNLLGLERFSLKKLPYDPNDVSYNPYLLEFQGINASKFILNIKNIS
jgi:hypothetical protein